MLSGEEINGTLYTINPETGDIVIDSAMLESGSAVIPFSQIVTCISKPISSKKEIIAKVVVPKNSIETDTEISKKKGNVVKEFEKWKFEGTDLTHSLLSDENKINSTANWCQFRENEKKFGLKSEFNEDLYTSKLDLETIDDERRRRAEEIEKDILLEKSTSKHILEERGLLDLTEENELDEEDLYSAVLDNKNKRSDPVSQKSKKKKEKKEKIAESTPIEADAKVKFEAKPKKFVNKNKGGTPLSQIQEKGELAIIPEDEKKREDIGGSEKEIEVEIGSIENLQTLEEKDQKLKRELSLKKRLSDRVKGLQRTSQAFYSSEISLPEQESSHSLPQPPEEESKLRKVSSSAAPSKFKLKLMTASNNEIPKKSFAVQVNTAFAEKEKTNLSKFTSFWTAKKFPVKVIPQIPTPSNTVSKFDNNSQFSPPTTHTNPIQRDGNNLFYKNNNYAYQPGLNTKGFFTGSYGPQNQNYEPYSNYKGYPKKNNYYQPNNRDDYYRSPPNTDNLSNANSRGDEEQGNYNGKFQKNSYNNR